MALWTPYLLSPAWWIHPPDRTTVTASGGYVSAVTDKGPYGRNATQATPANQPIDYTDAIGNAGTSLRNVNAVFSGITDGSQNSYTLFVVATPAESRASWPGQSSTGTTYLASDANNNNAIRVNGNTVTTSGPVAPLLTISTNGIALCETRNGLAPYNISRSVTVSSGGPGVVQITRSPGSLQSRVNFGTAVAGVASSVNNLSWLSIDAPAIYSVSSGSFNGKIHSVILCFGILSVEDTQKVEGWAAWEFGLTSYLDSGHPYKTSPPYTPPYTQPLAYLIHSYSMSDPVYFYLLQTYNITAKQLQTLVQTYGLNLLVYITQLYGDPDQLRTQLVARYQSNPVVTTILQQLYKSAPVARTLLNQGYSLNEVIIKILRQDYVLTQALMNSSLIQGYDIKNIYELANFLSQQYVIYPDSKIITDTTTLTINGK